MATHQEATVLSVGGPGVEVEMDEAELGRKPKGLRGHKKDVKSDVIGAYDRCTGTLVLDTYDKLATGGVIAKVWSPKYR